ncbi:cytochrome P450 [Allocatelliglobosispora scoriae]|uniref:Cytochrome P450 n=1 Tax=Allocatelliglobosispora scoriae TaxID=643052 RepID=A0A841BJE4_9ACTN|nr:cytochrome P450 [Allocatelliglobosispora scoriae]MBB5867448.1 cytochrome P450 [Allocatelliglobosispora scoriae]
MNAVELSRLDVDDPVFQRNPYPWYAQMRREAPLCPVPGRDLYFAATMNLAREVLADPARFSSRTDKRPPPPPEVREQLARLREGRPRTIHTLLNNDPPDHDRYRRMVNRAFTPRALAWTAGRVRAVAEELVAALPDEGDLVRHLAVPLPVSTICGVLGLGPEHRDQVRRWTTAMTLSVGASPGPEALLSGEHDRAEFDAVMAHECAARRRHPGDDLR